MKKENDKPSPKETKSAPDVAAETNSRYYRVVWECLFWLTVLGTIIFKIFKAHSAGIIFDEALTFSNFSSSFSAALNNYSSPNNHVLNSIFIHIAYQLFSFYEHFIRIPSLTAGILFSLALAYIVREIFFSPWLRPAIFGLASLTPWVFDYSYVARGYAFGLAGIYLQVALVIYLLSRPIHYKYWWAPALIISGLNFLSLGAILTSVFFLFSFNLIFVFLYTGKILKEPPRQKWRSSVFNGALILIVSASALYLLYEGILDKIFSNENLQSMAGRWEGWSTFVSFMNTLFIDGIFRPQSTRGTVLLISTLALIGINAAFLIYRRIAAEQKKHYRKTQSGGNPARFVIFLTGISFGVIFIVGVVFQKSLGFERNLVFFIPMVILTAGIVLDRGIHSLNRRFVRLILQATVVFVILTTTVVNRPDPWYAIGSQSTSGPLLRYLKRIDPDRTWKITLTPGTRNFQRPFNFYQDYYHFVWTKPQECELWIHPRGEIPQEAVLLDDGFFSRFICAIIVEVPLNNERLVRNARIKK